MASDLSAQSAPTPKVLLCLGPCHGEFYLPLDYDDTPVCPNDRTHDVAVYGNLIIRHYCDRCGTELGRDRAGRELCWPCEVEARDER